MVMDTQASTWYPLISYGSVLQPLSRSSLHTCYVEDACQWWNLSPQFLPLSQKLFNHNSPQVTPTHYTHRKLLILWSNLYPWINFQQGHDCLLLRTPYKQFPTIVYVYRMHILIFSFVVQTILCLPHAHFNFSITVQTDLGRLCCGQTLVGQAGPLTAGSWKIQAIYLVRN